MKSKQYQKQQKRNYKLHEDNFDAIICLAIPQEIRKKLKYSDADFELGLKNILLKDSKLFYCYWILNEIEKVGTNIVRIKKIFKDELKNIQEDKPLHKNIINAIIDEQHLWIRKLTEILCECINFSYIKDEVYFEHYILTQRHQAYLRRKSSYKDFFDCNRCRDNKKIFKLEKRIKEIENSRVFDIKKAWYLRSKKSFSARKGKEISAHASFQEILKESLKCATKTQKLILGIGYENYSRLSRSVHPNIGGPTYRFSEEIINTNFGYIGLLSGHILLSIKTILNLRPKKGWLKKLKIALINNPYSKRLYDGLMKKDIRKGDFVIADNEICEVIKITKNEFGYRSFTVLFLERPERHPCKKDDYLGHELRLVAKRKKLIEETKKIILGINPDAKLHGNSFIKSYRKYAIMLWNILKQSKYK